jgi:hypothetical protein
MMFQVTALFPCCERYDVVEFGHGTAYTVREVVSGLSFFVRDREAIQLKRDSANFTRASVLDDYIDTIGE